MPYKYRPELACFQLFYTYICNAFFYKKPNMEKKNAVYCIITLFVLFCGQKCFHNIW